MKFIKLLPFLLLPFSIFAQQKAYLISYFTRNGEDGLHFAYSRDGLVWKALKNEQSFLKPIVGTSKLMRDPCILRGQDGLFHMVWTAGWNEHGIGYASSKDLVHWSEEQYLTVMAHEPTVRNAWAPEIAYDKKRKEYVIFWASTIPNRFPATDTTGDKGGYNHRLYYTTTKDFKKYSKTALFFDQGFNAIDATILPVKNKYLMFVKDETRIPPQKNIRITESTDILRGYKPVSKPITGKYWAEGPTSLKIGEKYIVYFDKYTEHKMGAVESTDLKNWTDISDKVSFPKGVRHGTVIEISENELNILKQTAAKPLFRDPIFDGAADPVLVKHPTEKNWWMFYTNRRANINDTSGVAWVHGTRIGIATSDDGGATWQYKDTANIQIPEHNETHWAPDIVQKNDTFHMFLTIVPGIFSDWKHPRYITHLTSTDLKNWNYQHRLTLACEKVIDASVFKLPDGTWRMWYNNEADGKSIYYADSPDLYNWTDKGKTVGDRAGEAPKVFQWQGRYWMLPDMWRGLGVYWSTDLNNWTKQSTNLLQEAGTGDDDKVIGGHADVVISEDGRAYVIYFTHPGRTPDNKGKDGTEQRRTSLQIAELKYENGLLTCDRNQPVYIKLKP
jgi:predicted GH43/DUF377 family glycosyl hydrolase